MRNPSSIIIFHSLSNAQNSGLSRLTHVLTFYGKIINFWCSNHIIKKQVNFFWKELFVLLWNEFLAWELKLSDILFSPSSFTYSPVFLLYLLWVFWTPLGYSQYHEHTQNIKANKIFLSGGKRFLEKGDFLDKDSKASKHKWMNKNEFGIRIYHWKWKESFHFSFTGVCWRIYCKNGS